MQTLFQFGRQLAVALAVLVAVLVAVLLPMAAAATPANLITAQQLADKLAGGNMVLIDASPTPLYTAGHIPGAVSVDIFSLGGREVPAAEMQQRMRSWGISAGSKVVVYDQGGTMMATSLFYDLYYHGIPPADLLLLDGGLFQWKAAGKPVTQTVPTPPPGNIVLNKAREDVRVRLPEFLVASGDPAKNALIEALEPSYHYGETRFFDRAGHIPNAISLPVDDFYNADKTFKSPADIQKMLDYLGIRRVQQLHAHCGGGVAASVPFFAARFLLDYPNVKLYKESQMEWLRDERGLPFWTYAAPGMKRDKVWLNGWGGDMLRAFGLAKISVVDVRSAEAFKLGHVPHARSLPAEIVRRHFADPPALAAALTAAGINASDEAVIVSDSALNPDSALAFLALEKLGQKKVSVLMDSVDDWGLAGYRITKDAPAQSKGGAKPYTAAQRSGIVIDSPSRTSGVYPKVYVAAGKSLPGRLPDGKVVHVPWSELLNADGTPKEAKMLWSLLSKAGVPRYAEIICLADNPGEAAVSYYILKLMGFPDVKVMVA